jgi:glucose-6-phosphate 1-dehydrogenase
VPILVRAGKCLPVTATELTVKFRQPPFDVFDLAPHMYSTALRFRIYPEAQVAISLVGKQPGVGLRPTVEEMTFAAHPGEDLRPYDRLIEAAITGDRWLFARQDTVEAAWQAVDPVLDDVVPVHHYAKGSWGPKEADALLPEWDTWQDPRDSVQTAT